MVNNTTEESVGIMDKIRNDVREEMERLGKTYYDIATEYLITGEAVAETNNEKKLVNDITYVLTKISLLERMYADEIIMLENVIHNNKFHQATIEESLDIDIEVK